MRKIFLNIGMTLDGYIEDKDHTVNWHFVDDEFEQYINELLRSIDGMIYGRIAHQSLSEYWPTAASNPEASPRHLEAAEMMNALPKYAISDSGYETDWVNSHVVGGDIAGYFRRLKADPGKDIALLRVQRSRVRSLKWACSRRLGSSSIRSFSEAGRHFSCRVCRNSS